MKRIHLFEFEDLPWFPESWRDVVTDFLRNNLVLGMDVYEPTALLINRVIAQTQVDSIVDLCSGASGPWLNLYDKISSNGSEIPIILTDKYPNVHVFKQVGEQSSGRIRYVCESIDATSVPKHLSGLRTIFTGFHHFPPSSATKILQDAMESGCPICIFEFTERRWMPILTTPLIAILGVWLSTLRIRPLSLSRILWTYILPIIPLVISWDGVVSNLRTYLPSELKAMTATLTTEGYQWEVGEIKKDRKPPITYLLGYPILSAVFHPPAQDVIQVASGV